MDRTQLAIRAIAVLIVRSYINETDAVHLTSRPFASTLSALLWSLSLPLLGLGALGLCCYRELREVFVVVEAGFAAIEVALR